MKPIIFHHLLSETPTAFWEVYSSRLPPFLQEPLLRYTDGNERATRLAGKLLLQKAVEDLLGKEAAEIVWKDWEHRPGEKPRFQKLPLHFSIAHSGALSVVAVSREEEVGVDVEEIKSLAWQDFEAWLHPAEKEKICAAADSTLSFLQIWTRKEAVVKAAGKGIPQAELFMLNATENSVSFEGKLYDCKPLFVAEGYVGAIAQIRR